MSQDINHVLNSALDRLKNLENGVADFAQKHADILDESDIQESFRKCRLVYEEAEERLTVPKLKIATIGTTSSGKSTIVNALIGRRIAPIEAGEMSGGTLAIRQSKESGLFVNENPDAVWQSGHWSNLDDQKIYDHIRDKVMRPYHQARQARELLSPTVEVNIPILPAEDLVLLGLPEGIGLEIIDLPGLKSIQDNKNLKVIQDQVHKAFNLVTLDYGQVDDQHRKKLLEELKQVVEYLNGGTESLIFILNRVDQRGQDDVPIDERIHQLQEEIKNSLKLKHLPDIIPLCGRSLYYAQCAWGINPLAKNSAVDSVTRSYFLKGLFNDNASFLKVKIANDRSLKKWFRRIEDDLDDNTIIDDERTRELLQHVNNWSGGDKLWQCIRKRIQDSFSSLVILPSLTGVFREYYMLIKKIERTVEIQKIDTKKELEKKQQEVQAGGDNLTDEIDIIRTKIKKDLGEIIKLLQQNDPKSRCLLDQKNIEGLNDFYDAVMVIESDLTNTLIAPVRDAFLENTGTYQLEEDLAAVVIPVLAKKIAKNYDRVGRMLSKATLNGDCFILKTKVIEGQEQDPSLEKTQKAVILLYRAMREAMSARVSFLIQGQCKKFEGGLNNFIGSKCDALEDVCTRHLSEFNLNSIINSKIKDFLSKNPPKISNTEFNFSPDFIQENVSDDEVVGSQAKRETNTTGSCLKKEEIRMVSEDIVESIDYHQLTLPSYDAMAEQWGNGIEKERETLWALLEKWIGDYVQDMLSEFENATSETLRLVKDELQNQSKIIEENLLKHSDYWKSLDNEIASLNQSYYSLKDI